MPTHTPGNDPALVRAFGGIQPVQVRIDGATLPAFSAITMRRARGNRDPIGQPASCSLTVPVDAPPTWEKGDAIDVQLTQAALDQLYGATQQPVNLTRNPSFETSMSGWLSPAAAGPGVRTASATARAGGYVIRVTTPAAGLAANNLIVYNIDPGTPGGAFTAAAGERYSGRMSARKVGGTSYGFRARLGAYSAAHAFLGVIADSVPVNLTVANAWVDFLVPSTAACPAGTAYVRWLCYNDGARVSGDAVDVDAFTVCPGTVPPTAFFSGATLDTDPDVNLVTTSATVLGSSTLTAGQAAGFQGADSWTRVASTFATDGARVTGGWSTSHADNQPMRAAFYLGNDGATDVDVTVELGDTGTQLVTVPAGGTEYVEVEQTKSWAETFFGQPPYADVALVAAGKSVLIQPVYGGVVDRPSIQYVDRLDFAWSGTASDSSSTATYVDRAAAQDAARYRFTGRISDLTLDTTLTTASASIIATGFLAALGSLDVGAEPWPAEFANDRVERVLAAAAAQDAAIDYQVDAFDSATVPAQDVDRRSAQSLLEDLSVTVQPRAGVWERRDGVLVWTDGYSTGVMPQLEVPGEAVQMPLQHVQDARVNQATVKPSGKPAVGQLLYVNQLTNPSFETNTTGWFLVSAATIARDTVVFQAPGVASLKVTATAGTEAGVRTDIPGLYDGAQVPFSTLVRRSTAGTLTLTCQWLSAALGSLGAAPVETFTLAANTWTRIGGSFGPAPAGTAYARIYIKRPAGVTGDIFNVDKACAWDAYTGLPPVSLPYFDGASTTPTEYTYAWEGTAHASRSYAKATANTPELSYTYTDQASVDQYGVQADTVNTLIAADSSNLWATLLTRAQDQMLAGGWKPPDLTVDVLGLLDGRVDVVSGHETPAAAARQLLQAEVGSQRSLYLPDGNPEHMPDLGMSSTVTALNEVITPHRWIITTTAERTS